MPITQSIDIGTDTEYTAGSATVRDIAAARAIQRESDSVAGIAQDIDFDDPRISQMMSSRPARSSILM